MGTMNKMRDGSRGGTTSLSLSRDSIHVELSFAQTTADANLRLALFGRRARLVWRNFCGITTLGLRVSDSRTCQFATLDTHNSLDSFYETDPIDP